MSDTEVVKLLKSEYFDSDIYGLRYGVNYLHV